MITLNDYLKSEYGEKLYKLSLNGGMTCPNRDGTLGTLGCAFCNEGGSGDFTPDNNTDINTQIELAKKIVSKKTAGVNRYIAYFQAFTNTYASVEYLRELYMPVVRREDIAILSIGTRPDCLSDEIIELLSELNKIKPVWVELGLQTIHESSAEMMRRGYKLEVFDRAIEKLKSAGIKVVVHLILFWPGETKENMLDSIRYVVKCNVFGIKLQLLQVLKDTTVFNMYKENKFYIPTMEEYADFLIEALTIIGDDIVVHRITGDGPKNLLIEPAWCANKRKVMNYFRQRGIIK